MNAADVVDDNDEPLPPGPSKLPGDPDYDDG